MRIILSLLMVLLVTTTASADMWVKDYKELKKTAPDERAEMILNSYVGALGQGIFWANAYAGTAWNKSFFCAPKQFVFNENNYVRILEDTIEREENGVEHDSKDFEELQENYIGALLLLGLMQTFPCE